MKETRKEMKTEKSSEGVDYLKEIDYLKEEIHYLKRDLERANIKIKDLFYANYKMKRKMKSTILISLLIILAVVSILVFVLFFR